MLLAEFSWLVDFWLPVALAIIPGIPVAVWVTYFINRKADFQNTIRRVTEDLLSTPRNFGERGDMENFFIDQSARAATYYAVLYEGGHKAAATACVEALRTAQTVVRGLSESRFNSLPGGFPVVPSAEQTEAFHKGMKSALISVGPLKPRFLSLVFGNAISADELSARFTKAQRYMNGEAVDWR